jgi:hypothetical protein
MVLNALRADRDPGNEHGNDGSNHKYPPMNVDPVSKSRSHLFIANQAMGMAATNAMITQH